MVKVIRVDESGAELAVIEIDDFTIETIYAGIGDMLRDAVMTPPRSAACPELSREARMRREKILTRIHS